MTLRRNDPTCSPRALFAVFVAAASIAGFSVGCGSSDQPAPKTPGAAPSAAKPSASVAAAAAPKLDTKSPTSGSVHIDDKILKACGDIPTAHFAFDSASIGPDAQATLDALARCFVTGPLKGHGMHLVGHADPRGETEYNLALGQKRAGSVAEYLATKGLEKSRVQTLSKGAFEATGTDEEGWARDRKVDVSLAE